MAYRGFRVLRRFDWNGYSYGPNRCDCPCWGCTGAPGTDCPCIRRIRQDKSHCNCSCGASSRKWAGDIILVQEGHPHIWWLVGDKIASRHTVYDGGIDTDALLRRPEYARLVAANTRR